MSGRHKDEKRTEGCIDQEDLEQQNESALPEQLPYEIIPNAMVGKESVL